VDNPPKKCESDCREELLGLIHGRISKRVFWVLLAAFGLSIGTTGIKVWSKQESDSLRYANKAEMSTVRETQSIVKNDINRIKEDLNYLKEIQRETQGDVKEILKYMGKK